MKLNAPRKITFLICVAAFTAGIVGHIGQVPVITEYSFWLITGSFALLALANSVKGL